MYLLTEPGIKRKPCNAVSVSGTNSLPPIGGLSIKHCRL